MTVMPRLASRSIRALSSLHSASNNTIESTVRSWIRSISSAPVRAAVHRGPPLTTASGTHVSKAVLLFGVASPQCVMGEGTAEFLDTRSALKSPLAIRLMGIEGGCQSYFLWTRFRHLLKPEIYSILMAHFSSGLPLFRSEEDREAAGPQDTQILDTDSETVAIIKELLETPVRPAIMEDGGDIEYRGFSDEGFVKVKLKGSCRGCSSALMLMHYIPEMKDVIALDESAKLEERLAKKNK
ncbi:hypothetical protein BDR07DRAFT_1449442 [Suillus spraguei]|nr:hypothetical protein BDR07DRAFT_1449442 [Suillus spraguei]